MRKIIFVSVAALVSASVFCFSAKAQGSAWRLLAKADSARMAYDFPAAVALCEKAAALDSTVSAKAEERMIVSQNGLNMMGFCSQPTVVARQKFPLRDFFLFYPLRNGSWRTAPNQLDAQGGDDLSRATYIPDGAEAIYYSAKDEEGTRNIYKTALTDSLWSVPRLINEQLTSSSDEIYPMLSPDGQSLFFASKGLYGMGGYDLYVSNWNKENKDWDVPVNMGFPYSSPYDDFLFINSEDGKYSIFASNRECGKDSVCIYVLEYDAVPVRKAVSDINELRTISELIPKGDRSRIDNGSAVSGNDLGNADTQRYMDKMKEVRALRDSISVFNQNLDKLRGGFSSASESEKETLASAISEKELMLPSLNDSLSRAVKALQSIEMEFLSNGVVINTDRLQAEADKEVVGAASGYTFSKNSFGAPVHLEMKRPKPEFDYSFKILPAGQFAASDSLPRGLVYQIQLFSQSRKAIVEDLKGLSPVFEKAYPSGKLTYSVGLFSSYKDVLSKLNSVKHRGFRDAFIVAWLNGKSIKVPKAREMESQITSGFVVKIYPENGSSLSEETLALLRQNSDIDIVKGSEDGSVLFTAGPFSSEDEAQKTASALKEKGAGAVSVEKLETE